MPYSMHVGAIWRPVISVDNIGVLCSQNINSLDSLDCKYSIYETTLFYKFWDSDPKTWNIASMCTIQCMWRRFSIKLFAPTISALMVGNILSIYLGKFDSWVVDVSRVLGFRFRNLQHNLTACYFQYTWQRFYIGPLAPTKTALMVGIFMYIF